MRLSAKNKTMFVAGGAALCLAISAPIFAAGQDRAPEAPQAEKKADDADKAKAKKEVAELEAQRTKLDERLRDARKRAGMPAGVMMLRSNGGDPFSGNGEWSQQVKQAMEEAHKAMEEAMKAMHKEMATGKSFNNNDIRIFRNGDNTPFLTPADPANPLKPGVNFDTDLFREHMKKAAETLRDRIIVPSPDGQRVEIREFATEPPRAGQIRTRTLPGRATEIAPAEQSRLMDEIRRLRDEVKQLRDEVRKKGDKGASLAPPAGFNANSTFNTRAVIAPGATAGYTTMTAPRLARTYYAPSSAASGSEVEELRKIRDEVKQLRDDLKTKKMDDRSGGYSDLEPGN